MVEFLNYNPQGLYEEIVEAAREQGVATQEAWDELVEQTLDEHMNWGEVDIDDDVTGIREGLKSRFEEFSKGLQGGEISED